MGTGIVQPPYGGAVGYQFRISGTDFGVRLIAAVDEAFEIVKDLELVSSLIHRRLYFGWAAAGAPDDPDHVLFVGIQGRVSFFRQDRLVGEVPIFWSNDTGLALQNVFDAVVPTVAPPFATETVPAGTPGSTTNVPPHAVLPCAENVLQIGFANLEAPVVRGQPGAMLRMWPYVVTVEADRALLELKGAYNLATVGTDGFLRGYFGVYSQDHPF